MARPKNTVVEYRIYEMPEDFSVIYLDGEHWYISDIKSDRMHFHNCLEIGICHSGSAKMIIEETEIEIRPKSVVCVPQFVVHTTYSNKGDKSLWSYIFVDFKRVLGHYYNPTFGGQKIKTPESWHVFEEDTNFFIYTLTTKIIEEMKAKRNGWQGVAAALLFVVYCEILRQHDNLSEDGNKPVNRKYVLAPALKYISRHYNDKLYINELAEICNLSATHFRRVFYSVVGSPPLVFINSLRIEHACELLISTDVPILEVAETVGFFSISSFARCFKDIMGVTPSDYRMAAASNSDSEMPKGKTRCILPYRGWQMAEIPTK